MNKVSLCTTSALIMLALSGCAQQKNDAQQTLNDQSVMALNWFQQSGEYQALTYQAFNAAKMAFDQAQPLAGQKKAVVVEIRPPMQAPFA